jgi:hypothetical protein
VTCLYFVGMRLDLADEGVKQDLAGVGMDQYSDVVSMGPDSGLAAVVVPGSALVDMRSGSADVGMKPDLVVAYRGLQSGYMGKRRDWVRADKGACWVVVDAGRSDYVGMKRDWAWAGGEACSLVVDVGWRGYMEKKRDWARAGKGACWVVVRMKQDWAGVGMEPQAVVVGMGSALEQGTGVTRFGAWRYPDRRC